MEVDNDRPQNDFARDLNRDAEVEPKVAERIHGDVVGLDTILLRGFGRNLAVNKTKKTTVEFVIMTERFVGFEVEYGTTVGI
ncbi:hypothetical protein Nepgr_009513 [Nepenthes gracilis]|uniref:Uncharacterized protein n=1 Tax=Nepenthes gracilis TaxID=150966 RepID=A0AAD3SAM7_NEPGR|nr:hypothetical protein Nepgr_009513 [Nepenthes gracilis]